MPLTLLTPYQIQRCHTTVQPLLRHSRGNNYAVTSDQVNRRRGTKSKRQLRKKACSQTRKRQSAKRNYCLWRYVTEMKLEHTVAFSRHRVLSSLEKEAS